jgi:hypothetical protein
MNLRLAKGKVPILRRWEYGQTDYFLIDFPTREVFFSLYPHTSEENKAKYWEVINHRARGKTRKECAKLIEASAGWVAKIEFKFLRLMRQWYFKNLETNLLKLTLSHEALLSFLETETPESYPPVDDSH